MPYVVTTIVVDAPAALVYELAKDQERFPQFMPDVESVTVVERHPDRVLTRWKTLIEDAPIEWLEEDRFNEEGVPLEREPVHVGIAPTIATASIEKNCVSCCHHTATPCSSSSFSVGSTEAAISRNRCACRIGSPPLTRTIIATGVVSPGVDAR